MREEQKKVRAFYKNFLSWKAENVGMWIGAGLMETFFAISMMIPYQEIRLDKGVLAFPLMFGLLGPMLYLVPYRKFMEQQQWCNIYEKLKYLPIDKKEIRKMRAVYLFSFVGKIFPIVFVIQLLFSYWMFDEVTIQNIIYGILTGFVWPYLSNLPMVW